jgi:hypothetical protein
LVPNAYRGTECVRTSSGGMIYSILNGNSGRAAVGDFNGLCFAMIMIKRDDRSDVVMASAVGVTTEPFTKLFEAQPSLNAGSFAGKYRR